jgi:bifunctional UDP-N-acetylglucosamine pyrophosphorylase/glucosamine-1-phosphate N-acetyltransferase
VKNKKRRGPSSTAGGPAAAPQVVVLAAGVGSRMRSALPKVLHRVGGRTMLDAVLDAAATLNPSRVVVVLGAGRETVERSIEGRDVRVAVQDPPRGTGDAVRRGIPALSGGGGPIVVLSGDVPLISPTTLAALVDRRAAESLELAFLSFRPPEPGDLGRVLRDRSGRVLRIVEARNATAAQKRIGEVNAGVYCFDSEALSGALGRLQANPVSGEYYLTDAVEILAARGGRVEAVEAPDWREAWGINTRRELAGAEEIERRRAIERAMDAGATVVDPATVRIGPLVQVERDVVLHPFVQIQGRTRLSEGCEVLSFTRIVDSVLSPGAVVGPHCDVEEASVGSRSRVGPFARLRPGTVLEEDVRVGNFVETKKSVLRKGVKANHLAYLGDADVGAGANIGAGVITCNYDGVRKHPTSIGEGAFIGSDTQLVAPVTVGKGAYVGAGSTITRDVPDGSLAISRAPQTVKEGWAERRKARKSH